MKWWRRLFVPLLVLATVPLLVTEMGSLGVHNLVISAVEDTVYLSHGAFGLVAGHVPYLPHFMSYPDQNLTYLYPPLTLLVTMPPVLAGAHYAAGFTVEMLALVLVGSWLVGRFARRHGLPAPVGLLTVVMLLAVGPTLLTRVDALQGLLIAGSALALMDHRRTIAVLLVSLAVLIKETAVLAALPVLLWCLFPDPGQPLELRRRLREILVGVAPASLIFLAFAVWSRGGEITAALASVHRGLEIESVAASLAIVISHFVPLHGYLGHLASWQVSGADVGALAALTTALGAFVVVGGSVIFARAHLHPATAIAFAVAVGLCATPVLSPQYLLDLFPVLVVAAGAEYPARRAMQLLWLGLLAALLTQAIFPYLFGLVAALQPLGVALILSRNLILLVIAALLARVAWPHRQSAPESAPVAG